MRAAKGEKTMTRMNKDEKINSITRNAKEQGMTEEEKKLEQVSGGGFGGGFKPYRHGTSEEKDSADGLGGGGSQW